MKFKLELMKLQFITVHALQESFFTAIPIKKKSSVSEHCGCMSIDQIESDLFNSHSNLVHPNIRSLAPHMDELEVTISALGSPPIVGLCKT